MSIKPVLVPDHTANDLRRLMDHFADATTGPTRQQLSESRAAVAAARDSLSEGYKDYKAPYNRGRDDIDNEWDGEADRREEQYEKAQQERKAKEDQGVAEGEETSNRVYLKVINYLGTGMPNPEGYHRVKTMRPLEDGGFYIELDTPGFGIDYTQHNYKSFSLKLGSPGGRRITGQQAYNIINGKPGVAEGFDVASSEKKLKSLQNKLRLAKEQRERKGGRVESTQERRLQQQMDQIADHIRGKKGVAEGKKGKKEDRFHIVGKDGNPASLASYADQASAVKDRDAKHPGAEVRQVGPRGKIKSVSEGYTLTKRDPADNKYKIYKNHKLISAHDTWKDALDTFNKTTQSKSKQKGVAEDKYDICPGSYAEHGDLKLGHGGAKCPMCNQWVKIAKDGKIFTTLVPHKKPGVAEATGNPGMPTPHDQGRADAKKGRPYDNPYDQPGEQQEHSQYKKGYEQGKQQGVAEGEQYSGTFYDPKYDTPDRSDQAAADFKQIMAKHNVKSRDDAERNREFQHEILNKHAKRYGGTYQVDNHFGWSDKLAGKSGPDWHREQGVAEEASPMIKPPANRFDNKQEAFAYAKKHGGKVFKSTYINPNNGMKNVCFVVKAESDVAEGSAGWMLKQDPELAKKVRANTQGYKDLKKMAGKPVPKKDDKGVSEAYQFKGDFPFDVDHMNGAVYRGGDTPAGLSKNTKMQYHNKQQWQAAVNKTNSLRHDDNSEFNSDRSGTTVEVDGKVWAVWNDVKGFGWVEAGTGVEEGLGKTIKRGLQGWGRSGMTGPNGEDFNDPRDIVRRNRGYDDKTVQGLQKSMSGPGPGFPFNHGDIDKHPHSPAGLQKRVLDREMKKRGLGEEGVPHDDPNLAKAYRMGNEAYLAFKNDPARAQAAQDKIESEFPQYAAMWLTGYRDGERFDKEKSVSESVDPIEQLRADIKRFAQ